jgi:hypothetical protein
VVGGEECAGDPLCCVEDDLHSEEFQKINYFI